VIPALTELFLTPSLTPHGRLVIAPHDDAPALETALGERIRRAFDRRSGYGLPTPPDDLELLAAVTPFMPGALTAMTKPWKTSARIA
jgi:hypothetical protein